MSRPPATRPTRLPDGGLIDRSQPFGFRFDGMSLTGFAGDTLASALLANGIHLTARSFKYHRPRGLLTDGSHEPNALVTLHKGAHSTPNTKATMVELWDGLEAQSQNRWPSLKADFMAVNGLFSSLFVAGFYYKTFMWPATLWERLYEPLIRRAAGLGALSGEPDPDSYEKVHGFCDVLVVGAGPAGLMAARSAALSGARVFLCDEDFRLGGRLLSERHDVDGLPGTDWARETAHELAAMPNVRLLPGTAVFGHYDGNCFGALEKMGTPPRYRYWKLVAKRAVLATGATERPIVFGGNDRPGVMLASAVQGYLNRYGVAAGQDVTFYTATDSGWLAAADLHRSGINVKAIIDPRKAIPDALLSWAAKAGVRNLSGAQVISSKGRQHIRSVDVIDAAGRTERIKTDLLAMSGGWNPVVGLASGTGLKPRWNADIAGYVMKDLPAGLSVAGAASGQYALSDILEQGARMGIEAARSLGFKVTPPPSPKASDTTCSLMEFWRSPASRGKAFVDFQHDVTDRDIDLSVREGYRSVEHLKRYTTLGMATDQGRTSSVIGNALLARALGQPLEETGSVLARPPVVPVPIAAFAGEHRDEHFRPARHTPSHGWAEAQGAKFTDAGLWKRAQWFPLPTETHWRDTVNREVLSVRNGVGVCDVSTLGKIDIQGADPGAFLNGVYINGFGKLPVGKARYGVMLREDGFVMDDGTAFRLAEDQYVVSTTTANAARVMQHLEFCRQVLWPDMDVTLTSVTEQWAQYAIAGPQSRDLLQNLLGDAIDLSNEAFPFMAAAEFTWKGEAARLCRISFSGERAYELAVPAHRGHRLIEAIFKAGAEFGVIPYGTEALGVMRIEKGHAAGPELNGQTTPTDLGMGRMMSTKKDFIGRTMALRPALSSQDRPTLIGIKPVNGKDPLAGGAHFLPLGRATIAANDEGYLTSTAFSPTLGHWIGLGFLKNGPERMGERIRAVDLVRNRDIEVEVCSPVFLDPEGARVRD